MVDKVIHYVWCTIRVLTRVGESRTVIINASQKKEELGGACDAMD